jgi:hypothetical protein
MINFTFNISNPFSDRWEIAVSKHSTIGQYKAWEFNVYRTNTVVTADVNVSSRRDHAGVRLMLGLFGYEAEFHFYDTRHWDHDSDAWAIYNEQK